MGIGDGSVSSLNYKDDGENLEQLFTKAWNRFHREDYAGAYSLAENVRLHPLLPKLYLASLHSMLATAPKSSL